MIVSPYLQRPVRGWDEIERSRIVPGDRVRHPRFGEVRVLAVDRARNCARVRLAAGGDAFAALHHLEQVAEPQPEDRR